MFAEMIDPTQSSPEATSITPDLIVKWLGPKDLETVITTWDDPDRRQLSLPRGDEKLDASLPVT